MGPLAIIGGIAILGGLLRGKRHRRHHRYHGLPLPSAQPQRTQRSRVGEWTVLGFGEANDYVREACRMFETSDHLAAHQRAYRLAVDASSATVPSMDEEKQMHSLSRHCDQLKKQYDRQAASLEEIRLVLVEETGPDAFKMVTHALGAEMAKASSGQAGAFSLDCLHRVEDRLEAEKARGLWDS